MPLWLEGRGSRMASGVAGTNSKRIVPSWRIEAGIWKIVDGPVS